MSDDRDVVLGRSDDSGATNQRRGAALYDLLVLGWLVGVLAVPVREVAPLVAEASLLLLWLLLVTVEGLTGASPGKHVTGIRVQREDGRRVSVVTAALRRPWGWLLPLQLVGPLPNAVATAAALGVLLVMLVSTERAVDGRGFHDRIAGTAVVVGQFDRRVRLVIVALTAIAALVGIVLAAQSTPVTPV